MRSNLKEIDQNQNMRSRIFFNIDIDFGLSSSINKDKMIPIPLLEIRKNL
jgi:hypothetical protein